jgi:small subunit ribosomal protein S11
VADNTKPEVINGKLTIGYVLSGTFTKNNTMLTLAKRYRRVGSATATMSAQDLLIEQVRPPQEVVTSVTAGMLGFRGSKKSQYEAAFRTCAEMFKRMDDLKLNKKVELVLRQFGEGREAFLNVLNGKEGTRTRPLIYRVTDGTRLNYGSNRAPVKRRV